MAEGVADERLPAGGVVDELGAVAQFVGLGDDAAGGVVLGAGARVVAVVGGRGSISGAHAVS